MKIDTFCKVNQREHVKGMKILSKIKSLFKSKPYCVCYIKGEAKTEFHDDGFAIAMIKEFNKHYGKLHRLDGPAVIYFNNKKEYHINGKELNTIEVESWITHNNIDLKTKMGQSIFMLKFG